MNRHAVRAALVTKLRAARDDPFDVLGLVATLGASAPLRPDAVQIELVWPGDQTEAEAIYLLPSQGQVSVPVLHGTPSATSALTFEDQFTVPIEIKACRAGQTDQEAEARVEALLNAVVTVVATNPNLSGVPGLFWATVSSYDGPGPARGATGVQAYARLTLDCMSR